MNSRREVGSFMARNTTIPVEKSTHQRQINLNVGGEVFSPYVSTLQNLPESPLAWIIRQDAQCSSGLDYDPQTDVWFFDRHPQIFVQILNYFQTGKLHCPRDICGPMFQRELNYWGIEESQMEACCWPNYTKHREIQENLKLFNITRNQVECEDCKGNNQPKWSRFKQIIWDILDEPFSSNIATVFAYTSLGFIVCSIVTFSLMSIKSTHCPNPRTDCTLASMKSIRSFEAFFAVYFTAELLLRITFTPDKLEFFKTFSNWVDIAALVPLYMFLLIPSPAYWITFLNIVRYLRVFRFFKLLYDLQIIGKTLQASANQLIILFLILCMPAILFSTLVYYTENDPTVDDPMRSRFTDIPSVFWWGIISMTTIGYGDMNPLTVPGKIVGGMAAIVGMLVFSMTASVLGTSFQQYYNVAMTQIQIPPKKKTTLNIDTVSLMNQINGVGGKSASIKSSDSKDSGYGNSPTPHINMKWRRKNPNSTF